MSFFRELQRRKVFRVAAAYAVVAWLLIQVADTVFPALLLPGWTLTFVTVLLVLGFPAAIVLAWALDVTPDGIRLEQEEGDSGSTPARLSGKAWAYVLSAVMVAVVAAIFSTRVLLIPGPETIADGPPSIAVLPFEDLSPEGDQEYFGDGIAEELLNELTRLEGLEVASRTSSFAFKGSTETATSIGQQLGVNHVLEGSVRKSGDSLRITAQLIRVADGYHVWSYPYDYDRALADVFQIQEDIARTVAGALGVQFGLEGRAVFRGAGTRNIEAYDEYMRAFTPNTEIAERIRILEHVLDLDPDYAEAWAALGVSKMGAVNRVVPREAPDVLKDALPYIQRALDLDPQSAIAHALLGNNLYGSHRWSEAQAEHDKAIALKASDETFRHDGNMLLRAGRTAAAMAQYNTARTFNSGGGDGRMGVRALLPLGRYDGAREVIAKLPYGRREDLALFLNLSTGTPDDVRAAVAAIPGPRVAVTTLYEPLLEVFDSRDAVLQLLRDVHDANDREWPDKWHIIATLAAYFKDPEFALEVAEEDVRYSPTRSYMLWMPFMRDVRKLPAFKQLVTDIGLVDYWREYGWSDFCRPNQDDTDFSCD